MPPNQDLNSIQYEAVSFDSNKPLMVLAGAGSGKTKILTHRVAFLIQRIGVKPEQILLLTFTNKAAGEMLSRVERILSSGNRGTQVMGGTFHSFGARILRKYGLNIGISDKFSIFDSADQIDTVKQAMTALSIDTKTVRPNSVLAAISDAKNNMIGSVDYAAFARGNFSQTVARVYGVYQNLLHKYNALDFDDLLMKTVELLQRDGETLDKLQDQFQYVLVDEYQDTNKAQYQITKMLANKHKRLTAVGDAAQAIYSWRGADYKNLLYLKQDFPDINIVYLEQNYRSTQNILSAANEVISKNKNHPILKLWTDKSGGEKISFYQADSELEEASFVVSEIKKRKSEHSDSKWSDFAILYRTNAQSRVIEETLLHHGIPYSLFGGVRFYERKEVKDVLAYLRLLVNPEDEISRKRCEKNGKGRLAKLVNEFKNSDLENRTLEVLDKVMSLTGYIGQFEENNEEDLARLENIKELRSVAEEFPNLIDFLEQIALTEREAKNKNRNLNESSHGTVNLMTLHSAKGLEFKIVLMIGMEEGLFPHSRTLLNPEDMEEERRLCYVGMTRAMDKLYMTFAQKRLYFGQRTSNTVSRFLADIPENLVDNAVALKLKRNFVDEQWGFDNTGVWRWKPD